MITRVIPHAVTEFGTLERVPLTPSQAVAFNGKAATVIPSATGDGLWDIRAAQYVGVLQAEGVELRITPKVDVAQLIFLIAYSRRPDAWCDITAALGTDTGIISAVTHAFVLHADNALAQGVLQGYVTVEESLPTLRGRLREADQLRNRFGVLMPLEVTFDDFTVDIVENRILTSAAFRLLGLPDVSDALRRRLRRIVRKLEGVSVLHPGARVPPIRVERRNQRYSSALALAELILEATSIEFIGATRQAAAFLVDVSRVFEEFVTRVFTESAMPSSGHYAGQRTTYLDESDKVELRPDLTWLSGGRAEAVVDVKYKSLTADTLPNADIYQMLAYCVALDLPSGNLVYASGNELPNHRVVRHLGTRIETWTVDLNQSGETVISQVAEIASAITERSLVDASARARAPAVGAGLEALT